MIRLDKPILPADGAFQDFDGSCNLGGKPTLAANKEFLNDNTVVRLALIQA